MVFSYPSTWHIAPSLWKMYQLYRLGLGKNTWASSEKASLSSVNLCEPLECTLQVIVQQAQTCCSVLRQEHLSSDAVEKCQLCRDLPAVVSQSLSSPSPWCQPLFSSWTFIPASGSQRLNLTPTSVNQVGQVDPLFTIMLRQQLYSW